MIEVTTTLGCEFTKIGKEFDISIYITNAQLFLVTPKIFIVFSVMCTHILQSYTVMLSYSPINVSTI